MAYWISETGFKTLVNGVKKDVTDFFLHRDWFAKLRTGEIWGQGTNTYGQIGTGDTLVKADRTQVGQSGQWMNISAFEFHSAATKWYDYNYTDETPRYTAWTWGTNSYGQLGLGDTFVRSSPTQVGTLRAWKHVSAGGYHTLLLRYSGALWATGQNGSGQLGLGDTIDRSSPVEIGSANLWYSCSAGRYHNVAVRTDGTLWSWGANWSGQVGDNSTVSKSSPVQIGTLNTWISSIQCINASKGTSHYIKKDGTMWAWGEGGLGMLGDNTIVDKSSPIQIGTMSNWRQMKPGGDGGHAVKTDGTLWGWGLNNNGQVGDGTTVNKSSPVQIGTLSSWFKVTSSLNHTFAITRTGELWGWGLGSTSAVGTNNTLSRSVPVIMGNTEWYNVSAGDNYFIAQKL